MINTKFFLVIAVFGAAIGATMGLVPTMQQAFADVGAGCSGNPHDYTSGENGNPHPGNHHSTCDGEGTDQNSNNPDN